MSSKMSARLLAVAVLVVIFLAAAKQTDAQSFLLTYNDDRGTQIAQKTIELGNNTNITEVYTVPSSTRIPSEFSQTTMDAITVVWYVSTFIALMAFFFLMACSDRRCGNPDTPPTTDDQQQQPPPTPAPSYSEFAPPSYDTVMEKDYSTVFVVQVPYVDTEKDKDAPPPPFSFHTINELQKISGQS